MRFIHFTVTGLYLVLAALIAMAEDKKHEKQMDPQAMMEVWRQLARPGEPHKLFATLG